MLLYAWRVGINMRKQDDLEDVYYGVQFAYVAIIGMQVSMLALSVVLIMGIYRVSANALAPRQWICVCDGIYVMLRCAPDRRIPVLWCCGSLAA